MMAGKKAAWNNLSDADKAAKKAAMQARKAAWSALSDADKAAKKAEKRASWLHNRASACTLKSGSVMQAETLKTRRELGH